MKWWKIIIIMWAYTLAVLFLVHDIESANQEKFNAMARELKNAQKQVEIVDQKVYNTHQWAAELATDVTDLKLQDDAFAKLWLRE